MRTATTLPGVAALRMHGSLIPPVEGGLSSIQKAVKAAVAEYRAKIDGLWSVELEYMEIGFYDAEIWELTQKINRIQAWYNKRYPV